MQNALSPVINPRLLFVRAVWSKKVQQNIECSTISAVLSKSSWIINEDTMRWIKWKQSTPLKVTVSPVLCSWMELWRDRKLLICCHGNYQKYLFCPAFVMFHLYTLWYMPSISAYFMSLPVCLCRFAPIKRENKMGIFMVNLGNNKI